VTAAAVAISVCRSDVAPRKDFREGPTRMGNSRAARRESCAKISVFCSRACRSRARVDHNSRAGDSGLRGANGRRPRGPR